VVNASGPHALLMAIFFSLFCASGLFGSVTVSTPFLEMRLDLVGINAVRHAERTSTRLSTEA
jgi:hypothetical protein